MLTDLHDRAVLVTGGSAGIGRAIAEAYRDEGARVAITYRTGREAAEEWAAAGGAAVPMDLEDPASVSGAVAAAAGRLGGLDVLVLNAVRWPAAGADRIEDLPEEDWRAVLRANLEGAVAAVAAAAPALRASELGRLVIISSGVAEEGMPTAWAYAAAKAGLHGLARTLAWDLGRDGVLVNVVLAGFTATDRNRDRVPRELRERLGALTPQGRISSPEEVARLALFLGSGANASVTGEVVREGTSAARTPVMAARR